jgi:hypothetical protein
MELHLIEVRVNNHNAETNGTEIVITLSPYSTPLV